MMLEWLLGTGLTGSGLLAAGGAIAVEGSSTAMSAAIALIALAAMEIVLGIDNVVFISIITARLPKESQAKARQLGLLLAMVLRVVLILSIFWIMHLVKPIFEVDDLLPWQQMKEYFQLKDNQEMNQVSWKDVILILGGLFLLVKSVKEIHHLIDPEHDEDGNSLRKPPSFGSALAQIALLDIIFSLDSVITAVGMADDVRVMIAAMMIAIVVMMIFAGPVARFVEANPTIKMLALSFLIMIGVMLVAEGLGTHINKGYVYFGMAFSLGVEMLNLWARKKNPHLAQVEASVSRGADI